MAPYPKYDELVATADEEATDSERRSGTAGKTGKRIKAGALVESSQYPLPVQRAQRAGSSEHSFPLRREPPLPSISEAQTSKSSPPTESARPASLRQPFASLTPPAQPPAPSVSKTTRMAPLVSIRPKNMQTYCNRHRLAKNDQGACLLCVKEEREAERGIHFKVPLLIITIALILGVFLSALLEG